jgi:RNA polymerase sigma-70 factor (ECF subfamily)
MKPVPLTLARVREVADRADLGSLFRVHGRYVANIAARILGRDAEVDDVVQDVFLEAASGLHTIRDPQAVRGWLATITVRVSSRRLRWRRVRRVFSQEAQYEEPPLSSGATADQRLIIRRVYRVLDNMGTKLRVAWVLRYVEGESLDEVARMCGCSLATAKRRITAAHEQVMEVLADG